MYRIAIVLCGLLILPAGGALAGEFSPALEDLVAGLDETDVIKVLVVMEDRPDVQALDKSLFAGRVDRAARHETVVSTLQDAAVASQSDLLRTLDADKSGGIEGHVSHWIVNSVVVKGTVAAVRRIAERSDVAVVEPDLVAELIHPVMVKEAARPDKGAAAFVASGIQVVGADRVWHELGITGAGTLVANLDSGVDGTHPALASRWRGLTAGASAGWGDHGDAASGSFPYDIVGHGTHVMGTITGATSSDTVGVAPGAEWIASNGVYSSLEGLDNGIIAAFEWLADPDGNPATTDDVPDVCHNSWGVTPSAGYLPCDSIWWNVIDNCEAAGVVVTWSAGNEGPAPGTLRSPPDRATSPTSSFSIGSTSLNVPFAVSQFSSRGPSLCGGPYEIKPEVVAPGENIYSSVPGGGYGYMDGTSMAGPHVAGVVALMREAAPDLDVATIKEVLMETAIDLGPAGEDNSYGHGLIDAYAAVTAVLDNVGTITGTVTDADSGAFIADAVIRDLRGTAATTTDAAGDFSFTILGGPTTLEISTFGYETDVRELEIPAGGALDLPTALVPMVPGVLSGTVRGPGGAPLAGATVTALETPLAPAVSDAAGFYTITLPSADSAAYDILVLAPDLAYVLEHVGFQDSRTLDFDLPEIVKDGFESGGFATLPWQHAGDMSWTVGSDQAYEGALSARTGAIGHSSTTELELDFYVQGPGELAFMYKVDTEPSYDVLRFYQDGVLTGEWSGAVDWTRHTAALATGHHSFRWVYSKDSSASTGQDAAWIDLVELPGTGIQPWAALDLPVTAIEETIDAGTVISVPLELGNTGTYRLEYTALDAAPGKAGLPWLTVSPDSGAVHPGSVRSLDLELDGFAASAGTHEAEIRIASNDPAHPDTVVTVTLHVNGVSGIAGVPRPVFDLAGAAPNPFNPQTEIHFSLPRAGRASLRIYDVSGRLVRTLVDGTRAAGPQSEIWNGQDHAGRDAASGIYFARLQAAGETRIKSMALVR